MIAELEALTVGRIGVDLYAEELNASFTEARRFSKSIGGSPTNVAVALARLGHRAAVLTKVGDDPLGEYVRTALAGEFGVDTRFVGIDPTLQTPIVVAALDPPEDPQFVFYRQPRAPDSTILPEDVDLELVGRVPILWVSAGALAVEPSRGTTRTLLERRARRRHAILDLDYRPSFWESEDEARREIGATLAAVTIAIGNRVECEIAVSETDADRAADALLSRGLEVAVVKLGRTASSWRPSTSAGSSRPCRSTSCAGSAPGTRSAGRSATACSRDGARSRRRSSRTPRGRSSPRGCSAPTRCRRGTRCGSCSRDRMRRADLHLPRGAASDGIDEVVVTPEAAGWAYCGLRVVALGPGESRTFDTGDDETAVLPLSGGGLTVEVDGRRFELDGRESVFARVADWAYAPVGSRVALASVDGCEVALASSRATRRLEPVAVAAGDVPVETRGAGVSTRQVTNFLVPGAYDGADKLICCEVLTPDGNWSSYPPHKHDATEDSPVDNEEIYYFRIGRAGRRSTPPGGTDSTGRTPTTARSTRR